jgi:Zn-dependent protease with chaperone function
MTALLLALLVAQPAPDEASRAVEHLAAQLGEALRLGEEDPAGAVRLLSALLDDPETRELADHSPAVQGYRESALYLRARFQLRQGQAQAVADDMTALIDGKRARFLARVTGLVGALASPLPHAALVPHASLTAVLSFPREAPLSRLDWWQALDLRAAAYRELAQPDKEQADRAEAMEITPQMARATPAGPYQRDPPSGWLAWVRGLGAWVTGPLLVPTAFVAMVPVFLLMGRRQRRAAGGTWRRLFWVSLALAALQAAPVLAAFPLLRWRAGAYYGDELPLVTLLVFGLNVLRHRSYLTAVKWAGAREAPPLLEDKAVLDRVALLADRLGVAPPMTRLARSPTSLQRNHALITGLAAPTMVLYDGVLYRLTGEERDAIIAHELAHLANHTFWYWLISGAACGVAVVAASAFYPVSVALALGLALWTGSWLILSRRLELDCDRRAARAMGHRRTASALWKIHADQPFRGLAEFLIGAVSSHPSRDERLAAIRRDAPDDDRPEVEWDSRLLRHRRLAAWLAAGLWLSVIVACLLWGYRSPGSRWPALPLLLMPAALVVLFWLGVRRAARRQRRLLRTRRAWAGRLAWLVAALLAGLWAAHTFGLTEPYLSPGASSALLAGGFLAWLVLLLVVDRGRANRLNHQIVIALQSGDYHKALALAEGRPAAVARNTKLRYNYALVRAVLGRREEALADLERLRRDDPDFKMTSLLLVNLYADEGEYARALELAAQLSHDLPGDPAGPQAEAWLLRKLGRLEEAESRARAVLEMEPRSGPAHLTLAAIAFDRGDYAAAREQLARAERLVPGSTAAALLAAEMALATDDGAEAAVRQAVQAAKNNPLAFADKAVADLARRLEARDGSRCDRSPDRPPSRPKVSRSDRRPSVG